MVDTATPYKIVVFTVDHSITGTIFLRDQRLSDFLNDRREKNIMLHHATTSRLQNPSKVLETAHLSIIPKSAIVLAFEPPQKNAPPVRRFIEYHKNKYGVYIIMNGVEIRGEVHVQGPLDLLHLMADTGDSFLPITQANVSLEANPVLLLHREAVIVNLRQVQFIGEVAVKYTSELNPSALKQGA